MNAHSSPPRLEPDRDAVGRFLTALFVHADTSTFIALRAFDDRGREEKPFIKDAVKAGAPGLVDRVCARITEAANHSTPLVFCPPVATFLTATRARTEDLANGLALSVECDHDPSAALASLTALLGPPTITVASGGECTSSATGEVEPKLHLHWRLHEPTRRAGDHLLLREARQLATVIVGADATGISVVHPFRWPGSWHRKAEPRLARILSVAETEIDLGEALEQLRSNAPAADRNTTGNSGRSKGKGPFGFDTLSADSALDVAAALACIPNADLPWDEWNRIGLATWAATQGKGFAAFDAWSQASAKYDPGATRARWEHYATSPPTSIGAGTLFFLAARARPGWRKPSDTRASSDNQPSGPDVAEGAGTPPERPIIQIAPGELPRMADETEAALTRAGLPIFVRAGALVRPVTEAVPAAKGRSTTIAKLRELCRDAMLDLVSTAAEFQRFDGRSKARVRADPPSQVASLLLVREASWRFPRVAGVITTPTLRQDGSVLSASGYDPATRLYLAQDPDLRLPALAERPSREDAVTALRLLSDLLAGFPFVSPTDRAVALSGLITAVVRGGLPVAPMHVIRAHTPGTGKSLLIDVISSVATGRPCPVIAAGKTPEETEKRLGALLRDGVPIVSIDNVAGELGGDMLCQMTERPLVRIRILGRSEAPEFECKASVFATGNNLVLVGDMARRAVLCSLDAGVERPELRRFAFEPIARVMEARGRYVAAAITVARAYRAAGSPEVCPPIGSYGEWSQAVRAPLVWLGEADPVGSMETARDEDPELMSIRELFGHWREQLALNEGYTSNRIIQVACERSLGGAEFLQPEFRDLLLRVAGDGGAVSSRRLGKWLSRISGRIVDGCRLMMRTDNSHGNRFSLCEAK